MAYATIARAVELYGTDYVTVSCDRDHDGAIDTAATRAMLEVVTTQINGYLLGHVPLPLEVVPLDLEKYCVDMMIYEMCPSASVRTEEKTKRYDAAMEWLCGIKQNKIRLTIGGADAPAAAGGANLVAGPDVATAQAATVEIETGSRNYTRDKLRGLL